MRNKIFFLSCVLLISLAWEQNCKASNFVDAVWTNLKQRIVPTRWRSQDVDLEAIRPVAQSNQQELLNIVNNKKAIKTARVYAIAGVILISGGLMLSNIPQTDTLSSMTLYDHDALLSAMNKQPYFFETSLFQGIMGCGGGLSCLKSFFIYSQVDSTKRLEPATFKPTHINHASNTLKQTQWITKKKFTSVRLAGNFRISFLEYFLSSLSSQYREIEKPQYQYAKELNIDFQNTPINIDDLARFSLYPNLHTLCLRNSDLTDEHIETASMLGHYVKKLDIRDNPNITKEGLQVAIGCTLCRQVYRRALGFSQLKELIFDARPDLILDEHLLLILQLPKNRTLQIYAELQNKALLTEALQHKFIYHNSSNHPLNFKAQPSSDSSNVFYHDQNEIFFTRKSVYLPHKFSEHKYASLKQYLIACQEAYQKAYASELMEEEQKSITSFMEIMGLQDEFSLLANDFRYAYTLDSVAKLEKMGLLTEVRKIEALIRSKFLKSLKIVVTDNARI